MSGFTKGPWEVEASGYGSIITKDGKSMAGTFPEGLGGPSFPHEANARLIAAAPELYEALKQAVTSMQDSGYSNSHIAIRAARAALSKAAGEIR